MTMERWLITGASGQLGGHLLRALDARGGAQVLGLIGGRNALPSNAEIARVELADADGLRNAVASFKPTFVIHTAAMTAVSDAFARPQEAALLNTHATHVLAEASAAAGARFLLTSTDMVFDGNAAPYRETDVPTPPSVYGRTKAAAEAAIRDLPRTLTVRIPLMFGLPCTERPSTFASQVASLRAGARLKLFTDEFRTPIWNADAAAALLVLAKSERTGVLHLPGPERLSRFDMIARVAKLIGASAACLEPISRLSIPAAEPRPHDLSLAGTVLQREYPALRFAAVDDPRVVAR